MSDDMNKTVLWLLRLHCHDFVCGTRREPMRAAFSVELSLLKLHYHDCTHGTW